MILHCHNCHKDTRFRVKANVICEIDDHENFLEFTDDCWWKDDAECICMTCKYKAPLKEFVVGKCDDVVP